jgi:hypothetical protein
MVLFTWAPREREMVQAVKLSTTHRRGLCSMLGHFTEICGKRSGTRKGFLRTECPPTYITHSYSFTLYFYQKKERAKLVRKSDSIIQNSFFLLFTFSRSLEVK